MSRIRVELHAEIERWPLAQPFRISGYTFHAIDVLVVTLEQQGCVGRAEAAGVYYRHDTPATMLEQVEALREAIEAGMTREELAQRLGPGGARNALDCAMWELESKTTGCPVWELAGVGEPRALRTTFTCGADEPDKMAAAARAYIGARSIKLKLTGEPIDAERVRAVRAQLPGAWLAVDANQGFTRAGLERLMPTLIEAQVALIEQPFPAGEEALLDCLCSPIPIAADESLQSLADLPGLVSRFDVVNIKLDKCGGLTEALAIARKARSVGLDVMVGNMMGTSLAMAPAFVVGQLCSIVDLDGPVFIAKDRPITVRYDDGCIMCPSDLWG